MNRLLLITFLALWQISLAAQNIALSELLDDPSMAHASVSLCIIDGSNGKTVIEHNPDENLIPASILKLYTTAASLELLGPDHRFVTRLGYTGKIDMNTGILYGDIIIKGGGDPSLGSENFSGYYGNFTEEWIVDIKNLGIRIIEGNVITDDSYFDSQPAPARWVWEDMGNYYGAGAYGLSVFDNTCKIHFKTSSDSAGIEIIKIVPEEYGTVLSNYMVAAGKTDKGYVFAAPYSTGGWMTGSIPVNMKDFVLRASITDPPLVLARIIYNNLFNAGIMVKGAPSTARLMGRPLQKELNIISVVTSPPLNNIIEVLNHESVNLYSEHLIKELAKVFKNERTTSSGIAVINNFLESAGLENESVFMEDGSGLSPLNSVNSQAMVDLLFYMRNSGRYFTEFYTSLPDAGKEGTLRSIFRDPVLFSGLKAKSGSMTRVRSYAGYFRTQSGKEMIFCIMINNYSGSPQRITTGIEAILREIILNYR